MDWKHGLVAASILMNSMAYAGPSVVGCDVLMSLSPGNVAEKDISEFPHPTGKIQFFNLSTTLEDSPALKIMMEHTARVHAEIWKDSRLPPKDFKVMLVEDFADDGEAGYLPINDDDTVAISVRAVIQSRDLPGESPMENMIFIMAYHTIERVAQEFPGYPAFGTESVTKGPALRREFLRGAHQYLERVLPD